MLDLCVYNTSPLSPWQHFIQNLIMRDINTKLTEIYVDMKMIKNLSSYEVSLFLKTSVDVFYTKNNKHAYIVLVKTERLFYK